MVAGDRSWEVEAQQLRAVVPSRPGEVEGRLRRLLEETPFAHHGARSVCLRGLGEACRMQARLDESIAALQESIDEAVIDDRRDLEGGARTTLASSLSLVGNTTAALAELDAADDLLDGHDAAIATFQRAAIYGRLGHEEEAIELLDRIEPVFEAAGDDRMVAYTHANRGLFATVVGRVERGEADLRSAQVRCAELGLDIVAASSLYNLGTNAARRGDIPLALARFDSGEEHLAALGQPTWEIQVSRIETLLTAGLTTEAGRRGAVVVDAMAAADMRLDEAEARLVVAEVALLSDDHEAARSQAVAATAAFDVQYRPIWAAQARLVELRSRSAGGAGVPSDARELRSLARVLEGAGLESRASTALIAAVRADRAAGSAGSLEADERLLGRMKACGTADVRARCWLGIALIRCARGDRRGALSAVSAGLRALDGLRATLGADEIRTGVGRHTLELAAIPMEIYRRGPPAALLRWIERARASSLRARPVLPPPDPILADRLAELRAVAALRRSRTDVADRLLGRQMALERAVRDRSRHVPAFGETPVGRFDVAELRRRLHGGTAVTMVEIGGELVAVVADPRKTRIVELGDFDATVGRWAKLDSGLRRMIAVPDPVADRDLEGLLDRRAADLEASLLEPMRLRDGPVVIVPSPELASVSWASLPSLRRRPFTLAPSLTSWMAQPSLRDRPLTAVALVAGPELEWATDEVRRLRDIHPSAVSLTGRAATVDRVLAVLATSDIVHLVAHGRFEPDSALFSSFRLVDGDLYLYDLQRLRTAPRILVTSACFAGRASPQAGDELLGLTSALLQLGTRSVVASVSPVVDAEATARMVTELHRALRDGDDAPRALARSRPAGPLGRVAASAASFGCFGRSA